MDTFGTSTRQTKAPSMNRRAIEGNLPAVLRWRRKKLMPRAVRFDRYGGLEVLHVVEVDRPTPGPGKILVRVKAAFADRWPSTFPSGQGSDFAGIVEEVGPGVANEVVGDEVIGFTNDRSSQAELALAEAGHLVPRPANVS
jgi:NADPH:quinone reductase-like Zn-dependent oxidoreductase